MAADLRERLWEKVIEKVMGDLQVGRNKAEKYLELPLDKRREYLQKINSKNAGGYRGPNTTRKNR